MVAQLGTLHVPRVDRPDPLQRKDVAADSDRYRAIEPWACPSCEVSMLDMHDADVARRARSHGIRSLPAVLIDGVRADCCTGRGPDEETLRCSSKMGGDQLTCRDA